MTLIALILVGVFRHTGRRRLAVGVYLANREDMFRMWEHFRISKYSVQSVWFKCIFEEEVGEGQASLETAISKWCVASQNIVPRASCLLVFFDGVVISIRGISRF